MRFDIATKVKNDFVQFMVLKEYLCSSSFVKPSYFSTTNQKAQFTIYHLFEYNSSEKTLQKVK